MWPAPDKTALVRYLRIAGYVIAFAGIVLVALGTLGIWFGKFLGVGADSARLFSGVNFAAMLVIVAVAMGCFWLADRLDPKSDRAQTDRKEP